MNKDFLLNQFKKTMKFRIAEMQDYGFCETPYSFLIELTDKDDNGIGVFIHGTRRGINHGKFDLIDTDGLRRFLYDNPEDHAGEVVSVEDNDIGRLLYNLLF